MRGVHPEMVAVKAARYPSEDLRPRDTFYRDNIKVTVIGPVQNVTDLFGRAMIRYWCSREDTGDEGWMVFGPGGVVERWERP